MNKLTKLKGNEEECARAFDTYLKKIKASPELKTNDVMRYAVYEPDMVL